jgi:hypothetical protein
MNYFSKYASWLEFSVIVLNFKICCYYAPLTKTSLPVYNILVESHCRHVNAELDWCLDC